MQKVFLSLFFIGTCTLAVAQQPTERLPLTDWDAFRTQVLANNPSVRQANLFRNAAQAALLRAKGGFDVKSYADFENKTFENKTYFQYTEAGFKMPTELGLEVKANYNLARGINLNPEQVLPEQGQLVLGLNWTLGQGLFIDERRAARRQANVGLRQGEAERLAVLNDLMLDGAKTYWSWVLAENQVRIFNNALRQAQIRYNGIRESFRFGDKSAYDTIETFTQVQTRQLDLAGAQLDSQNTVVLLTNFIWAKDNQPLGTTSLGAAPALLPTGIRTYTPQQIDELRQTALRQHPKLQIFDAKIQMLDIERRLKFEKTKPVFDVNYNLLGNGLRIFDVNGPGGPGVFANNIKWGVNFSYPIQNRKARGDLQMTRIKVEQTNLEVVQTRQEIENKIRQYANDINQLATQVLLYRDLTTNLRLLLDGETEKFNFGESSIFLINTREQKWLEAQVKYLKLLSEYRKAEAGMRWSLGEI